MAIIECGFLGAPPPHAPGALLAIHGPTVIIDVGFDPALIQNLSQPPGGNLAGGQTADANVRSVPALIDTGASLSCIDDTLAQDLGLPLIDRVPSGGVHGVADLNLYLGYIVIPAMGISQAGEFIGANMAGQSHQALIGRSWLKDMIMIYDGRSGSVKLAI